MLAIHKSFKRSPIPTTTQVFWLQTFPRVQGFCPNPSVFTRICDNWNDSEMTRSSRRKCYVRKGVLRNLTKSIGKHLSLFFNKEISKNTFFKKHLWATASGWHYQKFGRFFFKKSITVENDDFVQGIQENCCWNVWENWKRY